MDKAGFFDRAINPIYNGDKSKKAHVFRETGRAWPVQNGFGVIYLEH